MSNVFYMSSYFLSTLSIFFPHNVFSIHMMYFLPTWCIFCPHSTTIVWNSIRWFQTYFPRAGAPDFMIISNFFPHNVFLSTFPIYRPQKCFLFTHSIHFLSINIIFYPHIILCHCKAIAFNTGISFERLNFQNLLAKISKWISVHISHFYPQMWEFLSTPIPKFRYTNIEIVICRHLFQTW